jgi:hypothetical protein
VVWEQHRRGFELQRGTVSESEVTAMLNRALLRGNLTARGDFDRLPIPFRAVATNLRDRRTVVLATSDLAAAARASMSLPLVLQPVQLGDSILADGGLSANIPVDVARSLGARRVIISDVSSGNPDSLDLTSTMGTMTRLVEFLFQQSAVTWNPGDLYIRPDISRYKPLDFTSGTIDSMIRLGGEAANRRLSEPYCPFAPVPPRGEALPTNVTGIEWHGARTGDQHFLARTLNLTHPGPLDTASIAKGLGAIASGDRYRGLWLNPTGKDDSLRLSIEVAPAARRMAGASLAYSSDLGGRLWLGVLDRNLGGSSVQGSATALVGQIRQELRLDTRLLGLKPRSLVPLAALFVAHESVRFFSDDSARGSGEFSQTVNEAHALLGLEQGLGAGWFAAAGPFGHLWHEGPATDHATAGVQFTLGTGSHADDPGFNGEAAWSTLYTRISVVGTAVLRSGHFRFGGTARYGWGKSLPPQLTLPLGGSEGFPGMRYASLRGDREAMGLVFVDRPVIRPLTLYLEGGAGQSATGGPALPGGVWWVGGRIGVAVDTPLGPIRLDYGVTRDWRDLLTFRLGHWF